MCTYVPPETPFAQEKHSQSNIYLVIVISTFNVVISIFVIEDVFSLYIIFIYCALRVCFTRGCYFRYIGIVVASLSIKAPYFLTFVFIA